MRLVPSKRSWNCEVPFAQEQKLFSHFTDEETETEWGTDMTKFLKFSFVNFFTFSLVPKRNQP